MKAAESIRKAMETVPGRKPNSVIIVTAGYMLEVADAVPPAERSQVVNDLLLGASNNLPAARVGVFAEHLEELIEAFDRTRPAETE